MRNFYTKNTVEAPNWCRKCGRETQWRIDGGRPSYCLVCHGKYEPPKEQEKIEDKQGDLFQNLESKTKP